MPTVVYLEIDDRYFGKIFYNHGDRVYKQQALFGQFVHGAGGRVRLTFTFKHRDQHLIHGKLHLGSFGDSFGTCTHFPATVLKLKTGMGFHDCSSLRDMPPQPPSVPAKDWVRLNIFATGIYDVANRKMIQVFDGSGTFVLTQGKLVSQSQTGNIVLWLLSACIMQSAAATMHGNDIAAGRIIRDADLSDWKPC
jgi:hypothetical protein